MSTNSPTFNAPTQREIVHGLQQTVSASRLSCFLQCRLRFFFRYVAKIKKPKTSALHVGSVVHEVLNQWNKARWKQDPYSLKQLHDLFLKWWHDSQADDPVDWEGTEDSEQLTAWRLIDSYLRETPVSSQTKPDAVEVPVEAEIRGLPKLVGVLDLVQSGVIVDFKTSSTTPNADKVQHTTEIQTSTYAVLYRNSTGQQEKGIELHHLVKLKNPKVVITSLPPMNSDQENRLYRLMEGYVKGLDGEDFIPSPSMTCASCEYFGECRQWH